MVCENAFLIVQYAWEKQREKHRVWQDPASAALEACKLRLRLILMPSIAFIAGVYPLVIFSRAGAETRQAMGVAVFAGMIGVTVFGLFLTLVFYVELMKSVGRSVAQ